MKDMGLFDDVFNKASIYDMFFFNIDYVLEYSNIDELKKNNEQLYDIWIKKISNKYSTLNSVDITYQKNAINHPEFVKIVAITYGTIYVENGELKRFFKKIVDIDERVVVNTFIGILLELSSEAVKSTPQYFPTLCGYNIIANDIPLLIKRFLLVRNEIENKKLPLILKRALTIKPWESGVIDVLNVWKFNGFENTSLDLISNFMGLKKKIELLTQQEISEYYWNNIKINEEETLDFISLQSATKTNLVIQLMNELRLT